MNYAELLSVLTDAAEFIEEEAENRSNAGSEMSDYEREPRELAERIRVWVEELSWPPDMQKAASPHRDQRPKEQ